MPVVRLHHDTQRLDVDVDWDALASDLATVLKTTLNAEDRTLQIMLVPMRITFGKPIYVEMQARSNEARPAQVIQKAMAEVEGAVDRHTRCQPRIRYFAVDQDLLFALG